MWIPDLHWAWDPQARRKAAQEMTEDHAMPAGPGTPPVHDNSGWTDDLGGLGFKVPTSAASTNLRYLQALDLWLSFALGVTRPIPDTY